MLRCIHPVKVPVYDPVLHRKTTTYAPCGKCPLCVDKKMREWRWRLNETYKHCHSCAFFTLTIDPLYYYDVITDFKNVFVKFMKRFRKNHPYDLSKVNFKYYAVTELGHDKGRLHYHVLCFNQIISADDLYNLLVKSWKYGCVQLDLRKLGKKGINYVTKYICNNCFLPAPVRKYSMRDTAYAYEFVKDTFVPINFYHCWRSQRLGYEWFTDSNINYAIKNNFLISRYTYDRYGKLHIYKRSLPKTMFQKLLNCYVDENTSKQIRSRNIKHFIINGDDSFSVDYSADMLEPRHYPNPDLCQSLIDLRNESSKYLEELQRKFKFLKPPEYEFIFKNQSTSTKKKYVQLDSCSMPNSRIRYSSSVSLFGNTPW